MAMREFRVPRPGEIFFLTRTAPWGMANFFAKIQQSRAMATRDDKTAPNFIDGAAKFA